MNTKFITKASAIAAIYVILVLLEIPLGTLAFGNIQIRIAEGLTLLPLIESAAIPGVFVGCIISNIILASVSGLGAIDIIGGSLVTLIAAYITSKMPNKVLGSLPPIILNGLIVSIWVSYFLNIPYLITSISIGIGELIAVSVFGNVAIYVYNKVMKNANR
ncbi:protein of unknown function DUF988 [Gottschalkia purinilytica]|uniref:QueT transporter n=1 Tax=Gottschalkia purinilytica TaxID=1503 RepID=A0A0L0WEH1_GOTPU|nr:QueT transporter family protein [Gottschalkia purinilytica]KNF09877.1 protein of unknown function DUF988 [Gottschalkia purinilytica]